MVGLGAAFRGPDRGRPIYRETTALLAVAAVTALGGAVQATAVVTGTAHVRVTATDSGGPGTTQSFTAPMSGPFSDDPIKCNAEDFWPSGAV